MTGGHDEGELVAAAKLGDGAAFGRLVEAYHGELHAHCYRMLGSVSDADDAMQEAMLRAWRALETFEDRGAMRAWLYTIATNCCLSLIRRNRRRELPSGIAEADAPSAETPWIEPYPDSRMGWIEQLDPESRVVAREGMELAFVAALQHLTGRQRAVLLLRQGLGFSARQTSEMLDVSVAAVNSGLQRARAALRERAPATSQRRTVDVLGERAIADLARRYAAAWEAGDVDGIVALLTDDVRYSMPPLTEWYRGREEVRRFVSEIGQVGRWRFLPSGANGQIAFGTYEWDEERSVYAAMALDVLSVRGAAVAEVVSFLNPGSFPEFGLPETVT